MGRHWRYWDLEGGLRLIREAVEKAESLRELKGGCAASAFTGPSGASHQGDDAARAKRVIVATYGILALRVKRSGTILPGQGITPRWAVSTATPARRTGATATTTSTSGANWRVSWWLRWRSLPHTGRLSQLHQGQGSSSRASRRGKGREAEEHLASRLRLKD